MKEGILIFLAVVILLAIGSGIYFGPDIYRHFGKRYSSAERDIYEENYSYVRGKIQHLNRLKLDYETSKGVHKKAFRKAILDEVASFDTNKLPKHLRIFINNLRGEY